MKSSTIVLLIFAISAIAWSRPLPEVHALAHSTKVAYLADNTVQCGGAVGLTGCNVFNRAVVGATCNTSPCTYTTPSGNTATFTDLSVTSVDSGGIGVLSGYDTVFLYQVCDIGSHPNLVNALNNYLNHGMGKVILYDGDWCAPGFGGTPDYSLFLFPFQSSNPGPRGATGTATLVESETLPATITRGLSAGFVGSTDAIGDSNTFTSNAGGWCTAVQGTNTLGVTGIQIGYARTPSGGLAIYNGEDNAFTFGPNAWDTQLFNNIIDQPFNPDDLPCGVPTNGITGGTGPGGGLLNSTLPVGGSVTVTTKVTNSTGGGLPGIPVSFNVTTGPNTGTKGTNTTRTNGIASFTYSDSGGPGTDTIIASFTDSLGGVHSTQDIIVNWKASPLKVSKFFTDSSLNPLPLDSKGNPKVDVILAGGIVSSTNPGQVLAWVNITNTSPTPIRSLKLNDTLPVDWVVNPHWKPGLGAIHVYFANTTSLLTNPEITQPSTITVASGNPQTVHTAIPSFNSTAIGHPLMPGQSILLSVKLTYNLRDTGQAASSYPRNYTDTAVAAAWTQTSFTGTESTGSGSAFFTADAKVVS